MMNDNIFTHIFDAIKVANDNIVTMSNNLDDLRREIDSLMQSPSDPKEKTTKNK